MADEEKSKMTEDQKINVAKDNVKKALNSAIEYPVKDRIKIAADALITANTLIKDNPEHKKDLEAIKSQALRYETERFKVQFNEKLDKAVAKQTQTPKTISQSAKAAAGKIGEIMQAALKAPGRVGAAIANKIQGKKEGQSR